jgi:hypothetical protein
MDIQSIFANGIFRSGVVVDVVDLEVRGLFPQERGLVWSHYDALKLTRTRLV